MVFKTKTASKKKEYPIFYLLGSRGPVKGDVGLEIEVEGRRLPREVPSEWTMHQDGSLRGPDNMEYVFASPVSFKDVDKALKGLAEAFKKNNTEFTPSTRTSVHVHLNVSSFYMNRLASLLGLWYIFEDVLTQWCGEHRVGNLFCMRAKDAMGTVGAARTMIKTDLDYAPNEGNFKYAALNLCAVPRYMSLEFRTLRGVTDPLIIGTWVNVLRRLYDFSEQYPDPREICTDLSYKGPIEFFEAVLGDFAKVICTDLKIENDTLIKSLWEGVRLSQEICYARDWSAFQKSELKMDPFGRIRNARSEPEPSPNRNNPEANPWLNQPAVQIFNTIPTARPARRTRRMTPREILGDWVPVGFEEDE